MKDVSMGRMTRRDLLSGGTAVVAAGLGIAGCRSSRTSDRGQSLSIGGLPVTCNLTLPVVARARSRALETSGSNLGVAFEYSKYSGWPEIKESLMAGEIQAAYMLAPLVMDLAAKKVPMKIVSLGHRSGAVIMVRADSGYRTFKDLVGKHVAIPSRFAVDYLFLRKMLQREGLTPKDMQIVEMAPADMPAALYAKAVEAYCTGEPFGAVAQRAGYATPLRMTRDEWPSYICCVLTVREELIQKSAPLVQELVNYVQGAGNWLDEKPENRAKAVEIAADRKFFNQDKNVLQFVMDNPSDRVTYRDMRLVREEFEDLMRLSMEAETIKEPIPFERYVDESFAKAVRPAPILI
jgi:NitT/TauT family transport system substrate-binding protein